MYIRKMKPVFWKKEKARRPAADYCSSCFNSRQVAAMKDPAKLLPAPESKSEETGT
jgi:hypothetical protein